MSPRFIQAMLGEAKRETRMGAPTSLDGTPPQVKLKLRQVSNQQHTVQMPKRHRNGGGLGPIEERRQAARLYCLGARASEQQTDCPSTELDRLCRR